MFVTSGTVNCLAVGGGDHSDPTCPDKVSADDKTQREVARGDTQSQTQPGVGI